MKNCNNRGFKNLLFEGEYAILTQNSPQPVVFDPKIHQNIGEIS
jgi:hypothetical protein